MTNSSSDRKFIFENFHMGLKVNEITKQYGAMCKKTVG